MSELPQFHGTTIVSVRKGGLVVVAGDGQVTMGQTVMKPNAKKVRRLGPKGEVIGGFAGATADAVTLAADAEIGAETVAVGLATLALSRPTLARSV